MKIARHSVITPNQSYLDKKQVEHMKESKPYTCSSPLFPDDSPLASNVVVREPITCASPIELQYHRVGRLYK